MPRKPIQIAAVPAIDSAQMSGWDQLFALCDDGTLWVMNAPRSHGEWEQLPSIPQHESAQREEILSRAIEHIRDAVLHERYQLAEAGLDSDQVNAVLGIIDDHDPRGAIDASY